MIFAFAAAFFGMRELENPGEQHQAGAHQRESLVAVKPDCVEHPGEAERQEGQSEKHIFVS